MDDAHDRPAFRVDQIDHVELFVPDRHVAADWYRQVLGLTICPGYEHWADDPAGPLMISSDGGSTKLALFEGRPQEDRETAGYHLVAFRVSSYDFRSFLDRLDDLTLTDHHDRTVTRELVQDHGRAFSIYFNDPHGHRLELTTYEVEDLKSLVIHDAADASDSDAEDSVKITAIEAGDPAPPSTVEDTPRENVLWMCHLCNAQLTAADGLVCSRCYRSICTDCVGSSRGNEPFCKSCYGEKIH